MSGIITQSEGVYTEVNPVDDLLIIRHTQNITDLLGRNAESRKYTDEIWDRKKSILPAAEIDMVTLFELQKAGIMNDTKLFFEWLERNPRFKTVNKTFARNFQTF